MQTLPAYLRKLLAEQPSQVRKALDELRESDHHETKITVDGKNVVITPVTPLEHND